MSYKKEENRVIIELAAVFISCFALVGLVFWVAESEKNTRDFCEQSGGKIEVVDREYNITTKTYMNVYGCVK